MSDILNIYTAEQLLNMYIAKVLADGCGLTDFNEGSKIRSLLESNSEIIASISMDFKEAIYKSIPSALYQGFGFVKTGALKASGYIRPYRKPAFWVKYTGVGTSVLLSSDSSSMSATATGAPADAFDFNYTTYPTTDDLVSAINALPNWEATLVKSNLPCVSLFQYTDSEVIDSTNYLNTDGYDIMLASDIAITIIVGYSVSLNSVQFVTTLETVLNAGESGVQCLAECATTGLAGNINATAIDTLNGKGYINSNIYGIDHVVNDSAFAGGATEETDSNRKIRFLDTVNSLNAGTKNGIISALKGITGVRSCGMRTNYPFKGTNTILVDNGSGVLSAELLAEVTKVLYGDANDLLNYPGKNAEGIGYIISAPTIVDVNISVIIYILQLPNIDYDEIKLDVKTAIEQYVNTRALGQDVLKSEIIRVSKNINSAIYNIVVSVPTNDISIDDDSFAKTGSGSGGTVTITALAATNT